MKSSISGFPEFLPNEQIEFNKVVNIISAHFEMHGFVPMDTAAVERIGTLLAKGNDSEIYGLHRIADAHQSNELGLRFDLTVPLARYITDNSGQLIFPHKRYQIAPVWRGERPQHGRYRQFYQCDIDIVGDGALSLEHDAEIMSVVIEVLDAIGVENFCTHLNNRKILTGFLTELVPPEKIVPVIQWMDKIDKITPEEFKNALRSLNLLESQVSAICSFLQMDKHGSNAVILNNLKSVSHNELYREGIAEIETVLGLLKQLGIDEKYVQISLKLARGLTYYTGNIFETIIRNCDIIGSISGGGRYDNLAETLSSKKQFPGVGATIGVSRLVPYLMEIGAIKNERWSTADVLVTVQNRKYLGNYMKLAKKMRGAGLKTEVYLQDKNLGAQLGYASRKGFKYVVIANEMELLEEKAIVRNMLTKEQHIIRTELIGRDMLAMLKI